MTTLNKKEAKALKALDEALEADRNDLKIRITTMIDGDVLDSIKEEAKAQDVPYQTLLNMALRSMFVDNKSNIPNAQNQILLSKMGKLLEEFVFVKKAK